MKIRKAVIPAAGLGTRFLPATKAQPKEMLPIVDKPAIQYIVEEAVASGIEEIAIIISRGKSSIENHFDKSYELEDALQEKNKLDVLEEVRKTSNLANISYIRQQEPRGLGDAILCAKKFVGYEPFAVLLGDDIIDSDPPALKQMIDVFEYWSSSIIAVQTVPKQDVSKYGIVKPRGGGIDQNIYYIDELVEKPSLKEAPSRLAVMGRYILRPEIFQALEQTPIGQGGELQLTDAINILNQQQAIFAYNFNGKRYDVGDKLGFIKATIDFALNREDLQVEVFQYMSEIVSAKKQQFTNAKAND
ncbi:MAG: UTP--glucose-1-phosphate uridylyltransferase GalU [Caldibacillus sp.]